MSIKAERKMLVKLTAGENSASCDSFNCCLTTTAKWATDRINEIMGEWANSNRLKLNKEIFVFTFI